MKPIEKELSDRLHAGLGIKPSGSVEPGKHTPGPWRVETPYLGTNTFPISHIIDANCAKILAEVTGQGGTEKRNKANAILIAASPDLLAALQSVLKICEDGVIHRSETGKPQWSVFEHLKSLARTAIAKATGGEM